MPDRTTPQQHYTIPIKLELSFLKWVHSHRLVDGEGANSFWKDKPNEIEFSFGGKFGTQFKTLEQASTFMEAFDSLLERKDIDKRHTYPLWYMMGFLYGDFQQQSIENNRYNRLMDYESFLLDLIAESENHFARMMKNPDYEPVQDEMTGETFFAKKEVVASMPYDELIEYFPKGKQATDVVRYERISFLNDELYIPDDVVIALCSKESRELKSLSGTAKQFQLPSHFQTGVFTFIVNNMLEEHEKYNTGFYQMLSAPNTTLRDFATAKVKYKKHNISNTASLQRLGTIVGDYLLQNKIMKSKSDIARFLFEYFALFKAFQLKKPVPMPDNYHDVIPFYVKQRINYEYVRYMMKGVGEI